MSGIGLREPTEIIAELDEFHCDKVLPSQPLRKIAKAIEVNLKDQSPRGVLPFDVNLEDIAFMQDGNTKPPDNKFFKFVKVPDPVRAVLLSYWCVKCDFILIGYTENIKRLSPARLSLYIYHELKKAGYNDNGKPVLDKPNCEGWGSIMSALGPYWESAAAYEKGLGDLAELGVTFKNMRRQLTIEDVEVVHSGVTVLHPAKEATV